MSEADFRDSILTLGFSQDQQEILSKFYESKQKDINEVLTKSLNEPHYEDLKWRFEAQVCHFFPHRLLLKFESNELSIFKQQFFIKQNKKIIDPRRVRPR